MDNNKPKYIALDFDETIATYDHWRGAENVGAPIPKMVARVKDAMARGDQFAIFTARANPGDGSFEQALDATKATLVIAQWCQKNLGTVLPVTHEKSRFFDEIWDDRGRQVLANTGVFATELLKAQSEQAGAR